MLVRHYIDDSNPITMNDAPELEKKPMIITVYPCRFCGFELHSENMRGIHEARAHQRGKPRGFN